MARIVNFKGAPLALTGKIVKVGSRAFDFRLISQELKVVRLSDFSGKIKVINFFPSLDTPVCDLQVKEFNQRAASLSPEIVVIGISKDLPFAQARFCSANEIKNEVVLSDYRFSSFGLNYGFLIKELNLLARGTLIIDKSDCIRYLQLVDEITHSVNFNEVFDRLQTVSSAPDSIKKPWGACACGK
ncbi:MAG: lipid hydroperoxide peroxidase [Candidatus Omnitrophica bacterium CG11_big_fil_rev_8_21_14_0_20_43_6]|nr:MAG: lipid hydroperoxide peroxidase [Candidatus Omnitrophica bacterium CG11_big_fil_rev_8_21_14_0_20_43_6]